ncbi:UNVERIFIED_ORG: hypothetical protein M2328_005792 [Rhodococcus erythropolis]
MVTVDDVTKRWIGDCPFDNDYIETQIADSLDAIRSYEPAFDDMVPDKIRPERVTRVVCRMVLRHLKNPDGVRQEQETTDVTSASRTYAGADPGAISFTEADKRELFGRGKGAYTISMEAADVGYGVTLQDYGWV